MNRTHRPTTLVLVFACLVCLATASRADDVSVLDGNWTLTFPNRGRGEGTSVLVLTKGTGTWRAIARGMGRDPCYGREFPVTATPVDGDFLLKVDASTAMRGCEDVEFRVHAEDGKPPTGTFVDGRQIRFAAS